jgi:diadenosine tetraphosphate (Ap4A) HIT family hydrolase
MHPHSKSFSLHPQLEKDSVWVADLSISQVRLHLNAAFPWLILVPTCESHKRELIDLSPDEGIQVLEEIKLLSRLLNELFKPDKLNIGVLGNIVPQLHVHVLARYKDDPAWPGPVWGHPVCVPYEDLALKARIAAISSYLQG